MTQYLILHKVRGEPAFDIAVKRCEGHEPCQPDCGLFPGCKTEEEWIIPTSGHAAHPCKKWHLEDLMDVSTDEPICPDHNLTKIEIPTDWPDHYACNDKPIKSSSINVMGLVSNLFPKMKRRF